MKRMLNYNQLYIEQELECKFVGFRPEEPKCKTIQFRLDSETVNILTNKLLTDNLSISNYMRNLVMKDLEFTS